MYRDICGFELCEGDKVEIFSLCGKKNAKKENKTGEKTIKILVELGGHTKVAYFVEGGSCHACDAMRRIEKNS